MAGQRVVIFTTPKNFEGAQVYLNGKCQGLIREELNHHAFSLMIVNVPPGKYSGMVRLGGYNDFQTQVYVAKSSDPPDRTPKVVVRFDLHRQSK